MKFTKMHGLGNDYVYVNCFEEKVKNPAKLAPILSDRHFGIGADGLILIETSKKADIRMRIFNADGSEAEACGNGLRCLVKYVIDHGLAKAGVDEVNVETIDGIRKTKLIKQTKKLTKIQVSMGIPEFNAQKIPVAVETGRGNLVDIKLINDNPIIIEGIELLLNFVSMGNPHAINFQKQPISEFPLSRLGSLIEQHKLFPNRTNFEVANIISRKQIDVRVWERGVGETLACGSGACAVAVVAQLLGYVDNPVNIKLPGGTLEVEWDKVGEVLLSGSAEIVFTGEWTD